MNKILIITLILSIVLIGALLTFLKDPKAKQKNETLKVQSEDCQPTFRDGGGPYYLSDAPFREKIVPEQNQGDRLIVSGKILSSDCKTPLENVVLDIWQANETGNYEDEWYRGQVRAGADGSYSFETVIPKGYGEGSGFRPPHIHFKVWQRGAELVTSQMFFPESKGKPGFEDAYIMSVKKLPDESFEGEHNIIVP